MSYHNSEWIIGNDPEKTAEFIVHVVWPAFIAEVTQDDRPFVFPVANGAGQAADQDLGDGSTNKVRVMKWIDPIPPDWLITQLLAESFVAITINDKKIAEFLREIQ